MPRRKMWVEWKDGADLSRSQQRPGDYSPLTRDKDKNLGHVTLSDVEEGEDDWATDWRPSGADANSKSATQEFAEFAETLLALLEVTRPAWERARPHVARFWTERAVPSLKSTFAKARKRGRPAPNTELAWFADAATESSSSAANVAPERERVRMTAVEAQQRLRAALLAKAFSDEQVRLLLSAQIEDAGGYLALKSEMEQFTLREVADHVTLMLEANPALLDDFVGLFRGDGIAGGARLPPKMEGPGTPPLTG